MPAPKNKFKYAIGNGDLQIGCWLGLSESYVSEISASSGFDWLVIDSEHVPNDIRSITSHLQVMAAFDSHPVVRPTIGESWMIKPILDSGAQTILVPLVESASQAEELVRAVRYPPSGIRGVGSLGRASNFSRIPDYFATADDEICLLVQVETKRGVSALDEIVAVDGVDGVFIGPSDLSAAYGYLGDPSADEVQKVIFDSIRRIVSGGKAAGILTMDETLQKACAELGATFIATQTDVSLFARGMQAAAQRSKSHLLGG